MDLTEKKAELARLLHIEAKKVSLAHIEQQMLEPSFWADHEVAAKVSQELKHLQTIISQFERAETEDEIEALETELVFNGPHDNASAFLSVHAGSGGTEAQDWAEMLLRMYLRFSEKNDYQATVLDKTLGEEAGIKSATLQIKGFRAFGRLNGESGVHRLVRISPFDSDKARHTSFALVEVVPEVEKIEYAIKPDDLKIDVFRAGGHGGQGVNTTDSAVRITHLPTKIVVTCQNERSQLQNKAQAMKILMAKLQLLDEEKRLAEEQKHKGEPVLASWGNQIRSYVLQPYQLVKDTRSGYETAAVDRVLDGDLDQLINSYVKYLLKTKKQQN